MEQLQLSYQGRQLDEIMAKVDLKRDQRGSLGGGVCHFCGYMAIPEGMKNGQPYYGTRCPECGGRIDP